MREHFFKGKSAHDGKWAFWDQFGECMEPFCGAFDMQSHVSKYDIDPSTVCKYTGLTDRNGVKIFEGDIVEAGYYKRKCQVVWDEKCARFICYTIEGERRIVYVDMVDKYDKSVLRVIGNIHDAPKAAKGQEEHP